MKSYFYNKNSHTWKDCLYIEMGPSMSFQNIDLVWCHCNKDNFFSKILKKTHSISHLQGHIMEFPLWVKSMINVLPWVQVIYFPIRSSV